jgi:hypothetical protein
MTLTVQMPSELESRLRDEAARQGLDASAFILRTLEQRLRSSQPDVQALTTRETELLEQINTGIAEDRWQRYRELVRRRDAEALAAGEHGELLSLSDEIEQGNARRMGFLAELADLKGVPLATLMQTLGIHTAESSAGVGTEPTRG